MAQLATSIIQEDLLQPLAQNIHLLPFESRKDTQTIFSYVLRFKPANSTAVDPPAITYLVEIKPEIIIDLCRGYDHRESATPCGIILREALKHEAVAAVILYNDALEGKKVLKVSEIEFDGKQTGEGIFWNFFAWIDRGAFEVSTDAFTTFRVCL